MRRKDNSGGVRNKFWNIKKYWKSRFRWNLFERNDQDLQKDAFSTKISQCPFSKILSDVIVLPYDPSTELALEPKVT